MVQKVWGAWMVAVIGYGLTFIAGACVGMMLAALMVAAGRNDEGDRE